MVMEMAEAPKVYCKKEGDYVPIWHCLGSYIQQRYPCPEIETARIDWKRDIAEVKCTGKKKDEQNSTG